jgi:hypothetical protein
MIVNRRTFVVKNGCQDEVVAMVLAENTRLKWSIPSRVYTPNIAPFGLVVVEWEYEDLAAYEKHWADWFALPETPDFMEKWLSLTKTGGANEIWNLEE